MLLQAELCMLLQAELCMLLQAELCMLLRLLQHTGSLRPVAGARAPPPPAWSMQADDAAGHPVWTALLYLRPLVQLPCAAPPGPCSRHPLTRPAPRRR